MENDKNILNFLKSYLEVLGIKDVDMDDHIGKILLTVAVKTSKEYDFNPDTLDKYKKVEYLIKNGQKEEAAALLESALKELNPGLIQEAFLFKLFDYLADLTDTIGANLAEDSKEKLARLISDYSS